MKIPILKLAMLVGMAGGLAVPLRAQDQPDLQTYLSQQNVTVPSGLEECKQKRDPRSFFYCIYRQAYPTPKRDDPAWQLSVIRVSVTLLDMIHAEPERDHEYFMYVIQIATEKQGIPYGSCGAADTAVETLWDRWKGNGRKTLTNLQGTDFHTAFRTYLGSACCVRSYLCPLLSAYNLEAPPDAANQFLVADQRAKR